MLLNKIRLQKYIFYHVSQLQYDSINTIIYIRVSQTFNNDNYVRFKIIDRLSLLLRRIHDMFITSYQAISQKISIIFPTLFF